MSKKILSVVLALVFVVSTFAVSAFAVGDIALDPEASTKTQTWALGEPSKDAPYTVDVSLTANYKVGAIQFKVANADENALLKGVALNAAVFGEDWADNYDVDFTEDGLVLIVPTPGNASKQGPDLTGGKKIVTLTYELAEGASSAKIGIANDPKNADNIGGSLIAVRMSDDSLTTGTLYYGQTVTSVGETRTLGSAAAADPVLKGAHEGIIINVGQTCGGAYAGTIYGFTGTRWASKAYLNNQLVVENGTMTPVANATGKWGTGATVEVYNLNGEKVATYAVVIFGDIDGNGQITQADLTALLDIANGVTSAAKTSPTFMAFNVAKPYNRYSGADLTAMLDHFNGVTTIEQNTIGAGHTYTN